MSSGSPGMRGLGGGEFAADSWGLRIGILEMENRESG